MTVGPTTVWYTGLLGQLARWRPPPANLTMLLNAVRDGWLAPILDDGAVAAPVPEGEAERGRELALLLAMLAGLERRGGDPALETRVRTRVGRLVAAGP